MLEMDVEKIFFFFLQNSQHIEATIFIPLINISTSDFNIQIEKSSLSIASCAYLKYDPILSKDP